MKCDVCRKAIEKGDEFCSRGDTNLCIGCWSDEMLRDRNLRYLHDSTVKRIEELTREVG